MLALQKVRPESGVQFNEVSEPQTLDADEVLVRVHSAGICGTDLHIAQWTPGYEAMEKAMPVTLGHEFSGVVEAVGANVPGTVVGWRITARPSTTCGKCHACLNQDEDNCSARKGIGIGRDGAFTSLVRVPFENCHELPPSLDMSIAALSEPMTVCSEAVETADIRPGQRVLVMGPGFIGQGIAILARAKGADVVVVGHDDAPRLKALSEAGFQNLIDSRDIDLDKALSEFLPFDSIIEAAGLPELVDRTLPFLKKRGVFTIVGIHPRPAKVDLTRLVRMHQQIRGSYRAPAMEWDRVIAFLNDNQELMRNFVSHTLPLSEALSGFKVAQERGASKVILRMEEV